MDFGTVELTDDVVKFWQDVSDFYDEYATEEVYEEERVTGSGHNHGLHRALGERGWVVPDAPFDEGGAALDPLRSRILEIESARRKVPTITQSTTMLTIPTVRMFGSDFLKEKVLAGAAAGDINICLGYTEPDGGSDLAGVRTRSARTEDGWVINGAKMFTTGAHNCQYSILVTRSDPEAPKHRGITIFLVPLDVPGVEIAGTHTGRRAHQRGLLRQRRHQ
ncbi:acyl-CoA dehydrogenase family protein [Rhodococcus fascians]|nr:acyl-CoA dehydrogenase family protein [Rhodococcus fascians]MBY4140917.1 acyl-CoA dehydrogenase family protein [Rhodococcus fascians]MBY4219581.1 acyl-CoA dehydrogenase family protein [Rhodococcus fascians]MBY4221890.1 acyl-CoA dehydrogenase family protein [Rhodococcus fascians]MBY4233891.1 acyl-CoA dehydrogenase family protein [Rhodococcus fascians]